MNFSIVTFYYLCTLCIVMEISILKNRRKHSKYQLISLDPYKLKELVKEMQESLPADDNVENNIANRFNWFNKGKNNPFGYDIRKDEKLKNNKSFYRRNQLRHKLLRIHNEFRFVKKNMKSYQELTLREKEIIQLLAKGHNNPEIAALLFISRSTVEQHRKHINYKLKIKSFTDLMNYVYAFDFV